MKKILYLIFCILVFSSLQAFADGKQEAMNFFNNYVKAANSYSNTVADMYSPDAKIIRQVVKPDGGTANAYTDTATYITQMKIAQAGANVTVQDLGNGSYKISSLRQPIGETYKLKTYMIIKKINGKWLITEELMQTKQQIFLKYAK